MTAVRVRDVSESGAAIETRRACASATSGVLHLDQLRGHPAVAGRRQERGARRRTASASRSRSRGAIPARLVAAARAAGGSTRVLTRAGARAGGSVRGPRRRRSSRAASAIACRESGQRAPRRRDRRRQARRAQPADAAHRASPAAPTTTRPATVIPTPGRCRCCTGPPPLALSFAPVGSPELTRFLWDVRRRHADEHRTRAVAHLRPSGPVRGHALIGGRADNRQPSARRQPLRVVVERARRGSSLRRRRPVRRRPHLPVRAGKRMRAGVRARHLLGGLRHRRLHRRRGLRASPRAVAAAGRARPRRCVSPPARPARTCAPGFVCQTFPAGGRPTRVHALDTRLSSARRGARRRRAPAATPTRCSHDGALRDRVVRGRRRAGRLQRRLRRRPTLPRRHRLRDALADGRQLCLRDLRVRTATARTIRCWPARRRPPDGQRAQRQRLRHRSCTSDAACAPSGRCGPDRVCLRPSELDRGRTLSAPPRPSSYSSLFRLRRARRRATPRRSRLADLLAHRAAHAIDEPLRLLPLVPRQRPDTPASPRPLRFSAFPFSSSLFIAPPSAQICSWASPGQ